MAGAGPWGPALYIAGYALAEMLFVPGLPLTVLGAIAFGPLWGTVWVSAGSTLGAGLAFLLGRYAMRATVERWIARSPRLARLDAAVARESWRILMVTRLVPLFPFNLQNFAYGLTGIPFWRYLAVSWLCMLPGTAAYTMAAGVLTEGHGTPGRIGIMLGGAGVLLAAASLAPRWLRRSPSASGITIGPPRQTARASVMLSIVLPVLNEARNLGRLLPQLTAHTSAVEIVVVDGGSDDDTVDVVARWPAVRLVSSDRGRARQMNAGARAASGETLLFLHADTQLPRSFSEAIARTLTDPQVVGGRFDVQFDNPRWPFRMIAALMNARSRWSGIATGDQAIFVRRTVFEAMGGYRDIPLMEDVELSRRLKHVGRLACLRQRVTTAARKWERDGVIHTVALMWALRFLYACGVSPARLHAWYYPALAGARHRGIPHLPGRPRREKSPRSPREDAPGTTKSGT
jgi:rSAM/selenodomain-associated transferase 2